MPKDRKSYRFPSWIKPRHAPESPNYRQQAPSPNVSNIQITASVTEDDGKTHGDHNQSAGSHPGTLPTSGTSKDDATKQPTRFRDRISKLFRRSANRCTQPSTPQPNYPMTTPVQASPNDPWPFLSTEMILPALVGGDGDASASVRTQHEPDIKPSVLAASSAVTDEAPLISDGDGKKQIIGGTKAFLRTAATALKLVPIPNLDQIPNTLLAWINIYENVSGNTEELDQLCTVIQKTQESVLEPLREWTGEIPPELKTLVQEFHMSLQKQVKEIESVQKRHVVERTIQASDITQQIMNMKYCLNDAIHRFELRSLTLILLRTEHSSVQSELSRLKCAPAEHTCVTSKSDCLPGTRAKMRKSLLRHLKNPENRFVWLRGSPGTGKTAISLSVASTLEKCGTLAASYFWDKNQGEMGLDSIEQSPSTLAHQLASFSEDFKLSLVRHLQKPTLASVQNFPLEKQMKMLMIEPMHELKDIWSLGKDRVVIVLDGLDECGNQEILKSLMTLVLVLQELPPAFAVLVSCRPEPGVISAWSKAQAKGLVIPCEDVDDIVEDAAFGTVRRMVVHGLQELISESSWKPTKKGLTAFARACRGLPVMASIRVRDVGLQTRRGRTLQSAFQNLLNLPDTPADLGREYLRILRQGYVLDSSGVPSDVAKNYRLVVGAIVAAHKPMTVSFMSLVFGIPEDEIRATLEPISSIVDLPSGNTEGVSFYHATAKEFVTGNPIGDENDKVFFINDVKGYFLGLPLLRLFNDCCGRNVFGVPTGPLLGDESKWEEFMEKKWDDHRRRFNYVIEYLFEHLEPSQLFLQESNELQNEFNSFIMQNHVLTWTHLQSPRPEVDEILPKELRQFNNHNLIQLLEELEEVAYTAARAPWKLYRMRLPFIPLSSPLYKQYGHLSDPVRIFSIFGGFSGGAIPLSEDLLTTQEVIEAKLNEMPTGDEWKLKDEPEFHDVRSGIVMCAALSLDGRYVALGFDRGIIEIADIDHQRTICRLQPDLAETPVWIEFVNGSHRIATEDIDGNVTVLGDDMTSVKLGTLATGFYSAGTTVSDNGLFVVRFPRNPWYNNAWYDKAWYDHMTLISASEDPSIQPLASPFSPFSQFGDKKLASHHPLGSSSSREAEKLAIPHRRTLGFSPGARYVGAFDGVHAFTWSTESFQCLASYRVTNFKYWIINPAVPPPPSCIIPDPISTLPLVGGGSAYAHQSDADAGHDLDESWIKRPFYDLSPSNSEETVELCCLPAATKTSLIQSRFSMWSLVWLNGRQELELQGSYGSVFEDYGPYYGYRVPYDPLGLYRPQSSRDGTRFLVQGRSTAPIVIDISQII